MATYVLVHGGYPRSAGPRPTPDGYGNQYGSYLGGHAFRRMARALTAYGHEVYRPTLTGFGSRIHLAGPHLRLDTYFQDIAGLVEVEDLWRVILVGYSFGGIVITGAAARVPERVLRLVYVDGLLPADGETMPQIAPSWFQDEVKPYDRWMDLLDDPVPVSREVSALPSCYIRCTAESRHAAAPDLKKCADRARERGWPVYEVLSGHGDWKGNGEARYEPNPYVFYDALDILLRLGDP